MSSPLLTEVDDTVLHASDMELYDALPDEQRDALWREFLASLDSEEIESIVWAMVFAAKSMRDARALATCGKFESWLARRDLLNDRKYGGMIRMNFEARCGG